MNQLEKGAPLPNSIGRCADLYAEIRALRLQMEKEADSVHERETEIREHIINNLSKSDDTGAAGLTHRAQIVIKDVARLKDWSLFCSWVRKNDRFDCLQKRISDTAVKDTMEQEGRVLPGIEVVHVPNVSITKI